MEKLFISAASNWPAKFFSSRFHHCHLFEVSHHVASIQQFVTMAQTQIPVSSLEKIASGKVRDLFKLPDADTLLFVASDRVSAFDVVMKNGIPDKGKILNLISAHWFKVLTERIPDLRTHFITLDVPAGVTPEEAKAIKDRSMQVRRLQVVKLESIV